jgi:hypothetical protein
MNTGMEYEDILMRNQELMAQIEQLHKKIAYLTEQVDRWEDDALRLMKERNEALGELRKAETECSMLRVECGVIAKERDEARRIACLQSCMGDNEPREWSPEEFAKQQGWDCFKAEFFVGDDDHAKEGL